MPFYIRWIEVAFEAGAHVPCQVFLVFLAVYINRAVGVEVVVDELAVVPIVLHVWKPRIAYVVGDGYPRVCGVVVGGGPVEWYIAGEWDAESCAVGGPTEGSICGGLTTCYVD
jgi:hypothetical protein